MRSAGAPGDGAGRADGSPAEERGAMRMLERARAGLARLTPVEALEAQRRGALVVDVRTERHRSVGGHIPGSLVIDLTVLPWRLDPTFPHRIPEARSWETAYVIVCRHGYSSSVAARVLQDMGLSGATDVIGGFEAWVAAGLPITNAAPDVRR